MIHVSQAVPGFDEQVEEVLILHVPAVEPGAENVQTTEFPAIDMGIVVIRVSGSQSAHARGAHHVTVEKPAGESAEPTVQHYRAAGQDGIQVGLTEWFALFPVPEVVVNGQFVPPESDRLIVRNIVSGRMKQRA
ncbi:MAG: hypothetical protein FD129_2904 [bacterium]|nr:MAG: hypothetical protein FD129_2904 [bacterium]